jgi:hypothetical protein
MKSPLSNEDSADLKSLTSRLVECEVALLKATMIRDDAKRNFENFTHRLQFPGPRVRVRKKTSAA